MNGPRISRQVTHPALIVPMQHLHGKMQSMNPSINRRFRRAAIALLLTLHAAQASAAYNPAFCALVAGTLNIHWEAVAGPFAPCTGIEFTDGTLADAADGSITMSGIGVSNPACIGTAAYALTLSSNTFQLVGSDTINNVPMTLTRGPNDACFVGTWALGANVYEAHIWAGAFPLLLRAIPTLGNTMLALLAALLGIVGGLVLRRREG
jgi:hypothetical protein